MGWIERKPTDGSERKTRQTQSQEEDRSLAPEVQLSSVHVVGLCFLVPWVGLLGP